VRTIGRTGWTSEICAEIQPVSASASSTITKVTAALGGPGISMMASQGRTAPATKAAPTARHALHHQIALGFVNSPCSPAGFHSELLPHGCSILVDRPPGQRPTSQRARPEPGVLASVRGGWVTVLELHAGHRARPRCPAPAAMVCLAAPTPAPRQNLPLPAASPAIMKVTISSWFARRKSFGFGSQQVNGLYGLYMAEAFRAQAYPVRFRSDEARFQVLGKTAGILGELEVAIRCELGADHIPAERWVLG
jgi:hypothetical protein